MRKQVEVLENHADLLPHFIDIMGFWCDFLPFNFNCAAVFFLQKIEAAEQGAFA
jgi:hypothetical protein